MTTYTWASNTTSSGWGTYYPRPTVQLHRGVGFPSTCRELAHRERTRRDPNGYYADLGLPPDADDAAIKRRCRKLLRRYHPDGTTPDRDRFERVEMIYRTLTDPVTKAHYDHTPPGNRFVDRDVVSDLKAQLPPDTVKDILTAAPAGWTYAHTGTEQAPEVVDEWYRLLARLAAELGREGQVRIVFSEEPLYLHGWIRVAPSDTPSAACGLGLLQEFP